MVIASVQAVEEHGSEALRVYYSDLYLELANRELEDVPFAHTEVVVKPNDSILSIATQHRFEQLDAYHLAAALYETNGHAFTGGDAAALIVGARLRLPTVTDIFVAQDRYENLRVVGDELDFNSDVNQMRSAMRWPFGKSLVMIGPSAKDELPRNQVVTLTSYRPDAVAAQPEGSGDFLARASQSAGTTGPRVGAAPQLEPEPTYSKWQSQVEDIAETAAAAPVVSAPAISEQKTAEPDTTLVTTAVVVPLASEPAAPEAVETVRAEAVSLEDIEPTPEPVPEHPTPLQPELAAASTAHHIEVSPTPEPVINKPSVAPAPIPVPAPALAVSKSDGEQQEVVADADGKSDSAMQTVTADKPVQDQPLQEVDVNYLGTVKNAGSTGVVAVDPLSHRVEWRFDSEASVGTVLDQLASYVGYELVSADASVLNTYAKPLPVIQRQVSGVSAEEGFAILAGRGLETVFDHVARSVKHIPRQSENVRKIARISRDQDQKPSATHDKIIQVSGIGAMLDQFPADMLDAADRHAARCNSTEHNQMPESARLYEAIAVRLGRQTPEPVVRGLADWYESPVGRKVLSLAQLEIDEAKLQRFEVAKKRKPLIRSIYENTVTGQGIAGIAIELEYAGWELSGCQQRAELSGDVKAMNQEMVHGQGIKKKSGKLESLLQEDMLRTLAYQFSSLGEVELKEYAQITEQYAGVYAELQQAIIAAIQSETKEVIVSSLH
jgi:hypothetical protein